jgi:putative ABC transport system substrate-binding protein
MRRRDFIKVVAGSAIAWPLAERAQTSPVQIAQVGIIDDAPIWNPFRQQLREMNYVEGQNIAFEYRQAEGIPDRLQAAAEDLAHIPVNIIAIFGTPAAQAAQRATKTIPIVAIAIGDPIGAGLIASLARPGGNITGNTILGPDVVTKRLQILKDAIPSVSRIAFLWNPDNDSNKRHLEHLREAEPLFHMTLLPLPARTADDFERVFAQLQSDPPEALLTTNDPVHQTRMAAVSYGASTPDLFRTSMPYFDALRGVAVRSCW